MTDLSESSARRFTFESVQDEVGTYDLTSMRIANRFKAVVASNPLMADPQMTQAVLAMAQSELPLSQVVTQGGQIYGMQMGSQLANRLREMPSQQQRAVYGRLTTAQQRALGSMGYQIPTGDGGGTFDFLPDIIERPLGMIGGAVTGATGKVIKGASQFVSPVVSPILETLNWVGDQPAHLYRTIRLLDDDSQIMGALGAVAGIGLMAASGLVTGGLGTLATAGMLAAGGLAGAAAGSAGNELIGGNPHDWWRAFMDSRDGERTFDRPSKQRARDLLGDPRLTGLARDIAGVTDLDLDELAEEMAGLRDASQPAQLARLAEIATDIAPAGTPDHEKAYQAMLNALNDDTFRDAVRTLQMGKISVGRDIADNIGLDPGTGAYNVVSGIADAAWTIAVDPTLLLGEAATFHKARTRGMELVGEGIAPSERFLAIQRDVPGVRRLHEMVAQSVNLERYDLVDRFAPSFRPVFYELIGHKRALARDGYSGEFGIDQFNEYFVQADRMKQLMSGVGAVKAERGVVLESLGTVTAGWRNAVSTLRSFAGGLNDARLERQAVDVLEANRDLPMVKAVYPQALWGDLTDTGMILDAARTTELHQGVYKTGHMLGSIPLAGKVVGRVGGVVEGMMTMLGKDKVLHLWGDRAAEDVKAFTELGRYTGMPTWARRAYRDAILTADSPSDRVHLVMGALDEMLTLAGARTNRVDSELTDRFLNAQRMAFGALDTTLVGNRERQLGVLQAEMARELVMPNLAELRKAAVTGHLAKYVLAVADHPILETAMTKVWKPAVILRIGFIPRAAGEELLNFMVRAGTGSLVENYAASSVAQGKVWREAQDIRLNTPTGVTEQLTEAQLQLLNKGLTGALPAHVRPLVRMMNHWEWSKPGTKKISEYGDWLRKQMEFGVFGREGATAAERLAQGASARTVAAIGGGQDAARGFGAARGNVGQVAENLLLGKSSSWRRMLSGGVNDTALASMLAFEREFATMVLREVTSRTHGVYDYDRNPGLEQRVTTRGGEEVTLGVLRGQYSLSPVEELGEYQRKKHGEVHRVVSDELVGPALARHARHMRSGVTVDDATVDEFIERFRTLRSDNGYEVAIEYLSSSPNPETLRSAIARVQLSDEDLGFVWAGHTPELRMPSIDVYIADAEQHALTIEAKLNAVSSAKAATYLTDALDRARGVVADLTTAKELAGRMAGMSPNDRAYLAAVMRQEGRPGQWVDRSVATAPTSQQLPAHIQKRLSKQTVMQQRPNTFVGQADSLREELRTGWIEAQRQGTTAWSARFKADEGLPGTQVMVYEAELPMYGGRMLSPDDIIRLSPNPEVTMRYRADFERMAESARLNFDGRSSLFVADQELAQQLAAVRARVYKRAVPQARPRVGYFDRSVLAGDADGLKALNLTDGGNATLWTGRKDMLVNRIVPMPQTIDEAADEAADVLMRQLRSQVTRRSGNQLYARRRPLDPDENGNPQDEPLVFHYSKQFGVPEPVGVDDPIVGGHRYVDKNGKDIPSGSLAHFERRAGAVDPEGEIMWELVGPMLEDLADRTYGSARFLARETGMKPDAQLAAVQDGSMVQWYRSRYQHVGRVSPDDLPEWAVGETLALPKHESTWDRIVRFGFDRVIGPSIDAIVRRPMARHFYRQRYEWTKEATKFLRDDDLLARVGGGLGRVASQVPGYSAAEAEDWADFARQYAKWDGDDMADTWTRKQAISWLSGLNERELDDVMTKGRANSIALGSRGHRVLMQNVDRPWIDPDANGEDFLAAIRAALTDEAKGIDGSEIMRNARRLRGARAQRIIDENPLLRGLSVDDWDAIRRAEMNVSSIETHAGQLAAEFAIKDMLPYVDSHEIRTQFAEGGKQFLPFWYAEENFMRRWALTIAQHPETIRKLQLGYAGLRSGGIIRTDESGRDWVVIPGSQALIEAVAKVPGLDVLPVGAAFQTPTDSILPGMSSRFGSPAFSPLVTMPVDIVATWAPELQPLEKALVGDYISTRPAIMQLFPTQVVNFLDAALADDSSTRYASAMTTAIAQLEAQGRGLRDGATEGEKDDYLRTVRNHARVIVTAQALMGFFSPGPPSLVNGEGGPAGLGFEVDAEVFSAEYRTLIRSLGIEQGTIEFLKLHPESDPHHLVQNPLAYTVPKSASKSGAPIPGTTEAVGFYLQNQEAFDAFPDAAPWLLPGDNGERRSQYAADAQAINALRQMRTPEEFLDAIKYKEAARTYFESRADYTEKLAVAQARGDRDAQRQLDSEWRIFAEMYKAQHPVFRQQLEAGDARDRRRRTIQQMRVLLDDPLAPDSGNLGIMREALQVFDAYSLTLTDLQHDRTARADLAKERLKTTYTKTMTEMVAANPQLGSFWQAVLRPESSLDG